ncbi:MAG: hypothetical protein M9907_15330 [Burkholderiaceae bacterium]|nr:hypothetical protein [Burkholderiaceae bacterium]
MDPYTHESPPSGGLPQRQYIAGNEALKCSVTGCASTRYRTSPFCRSHYSAWSRYGGIGRRHLPAEPIRRIQKEVMDLLQDPMQVHHPGLQVAVQGLQRLFRSKAVHEDPKLDLLRRLANAGADPLDVIAITAAVYCHLWRTDPEAYEDGDYTAAQVGRLLGKLAPLKHRGGGELRSLRRSRAMVGAILERIGPLVSLIITTLERDRRARNGKRRYRRKPVDEQCEQHGQCDHFDEDDHNMEQYEA